VARGRSVRDCLVWAFIIGGHALLILVFMGSKRQVQQLSDDAPSLGVLMLLDLPAEASGSEAVSDTPQLASVPVITPRLPTPELDSESTAITLPEQSEEGPGTNAIDWQLEAQRSAHATVERNRQSREKRIGEHPPSPFTPKKKPKEFEWDPEPDRAGFAEGFIPYVRIGQRCVVGLGFFGCNLSKLPEANSHLFDGMHDPDRQRSSVPEVDTSSALDPPPD
jgi:hypothetical protein